MLSGSMRRAGWCLLSLMAAGCGDRALTVAVPDAGAPPDGAAVEVGPAPGSVSAAAPAGVPGETGGATTLGPLVALSDGGVVVAGTFSGSVAFAPDKVLAASGPHDGFVARYRRDMRLVWVVPLVSGGEQVVIADAAVLAGDEVVIAGWFSGALKVGGQALASAGGLDAFAVRLA